MDCMIAAVHCLVLHASLVMANFLLELCPDFQQTSSLPDMHDQNSHYPQQLLHHGPPSAQSTRKGLVPHGTCLALNMCM